MSEYITVPLDTNPEVVLEDMHSFMRLVFPGWQPNDGQLDTIILRTMAIAIAENRDVASRVPTSIFRTLGMSLFSFPPIDATYATVPSTWTAVDTAGHTVPAGTNVVIRNAAGEAFTFEVLSDVAVPGGSSTTAAGAVLLRAVDPGVDASGLGVANQPVELIDTLAWVNTVVITSATSGGRDAETDDEYVDRLSLRLRRLSFRPILPQDFADLALEANPAIVRTVAIDGYNPANQTSNNERMVAVAGHDGAGNALSGAVKAAVDALLQANREITFVVNVIDPTFTNVSVTYNVKARPNYDTADLLVRVNAALTAYLNPVTWGDPEGTGTVWELLTTVRFYEIVQVINNVEGVAYIIGNPTIGVQGQALAQTDVVLTGAAPLVRTGTLTGTVTP